MEITLSPLSDNASLEREGVEVFDVSEALKAVGISESSCDLNQRSTRQSIGAVLLRAMESRFGVRPSTWQIQAA